MRAFVQYKGKHPFSHAAIVSAEGFEQRGAEVVPFDPAEVETRKWDAADPVVGDALAARDEAKCEDSPSMVNNA